MPSPVQVCADVQEKKARPYPPVARTTFLGAEAMERSIVQLPGGYASTCAFLVHDQVEREILDEEFRLVLERLPVKRMQHGVTRPVGCCAGSLNRAFTVILCHAAKGTLINLAFLGARKGHAPVLEFVHGGGRILGQVLNRILIAEPVRSLDGVVHVPAPVVFRHVAKRSRYATLSGDSVGAGRKNLGDARCLQTGLRGTESRPETGPPGAHHHHVICVIDPFVIAHASCLPVAPGADALTANPDFQHRRCCGHEEDNGRERVQDQQRLFHTRTMNVVLDDDLHAQSHVKECRSG